MSQIVCIVAAPEVRRVCPSDFIEGRWMKIPDEAKEITIATPPGVRPLMVRPTGRWARNEAGQSAPIWEVRWEDFAAE